MLPFSPQQIKRQCSSKDPDEPLRCAHFPPSHFPDWNREDEPASGVSGSGISTSICAAVCSVVEWCRRILLLSWYRFTNEIGGAKLDAQGNYVWMG